MKSLKDWSAKRAGGRITVTGKDETGQITKVVGVDTIEAQGVGTVATHKSGEQYLLSPWVSP